VKGSRPRPPSLPRSRLLLYDDTPESRMGHFVRFERVMASG
jgi:hypothetical protein